MGEQPGSMEEDDFKLELPDEPVQEKKELSREEKEQAIQERFQSRMAELKKEEDDAEDTFSTIPDNDELVRINSLKKAFQEKRRSIGLERDAAFTVLDAENQEK